MPVTTEEALEFIRAGREAASHARRLVAFQLATGLDLAQALAAPPGERERIVRRVSRLVERERLKGAGRHWSYDLNRHIALAEALNCLRGEPDDGKPEPAGAAVRRPTHAPGADGRTAPQGAVVGVSGRSGKAGRLPRLSGSCASCGPGPSSSPVATVPPHRTGRPSDRTPRDPTSRDTAPASGHNGSSGAA